MKIRAGAGPPAWQATRRRSGEAVDLDDLYENPLPLRGISPASELSKDSHGRKTAISARLRRRNSGAHVRLPFGNSTFEGPGQHRMESEV